MTASSHDSTRNQCMLKGPLRKQGYDWWWHSFTAYHEQTGEARAFFIEYFVCNPDLAEDEPVLGQLPANKEAGKKPSYLMMKAGTWGEGKCQLHRFFPWKEVEIAGGAPYYVQADDCFACDTDLMGSVHVADADAAAHPEWMCDGGSMAWDLHLDKQIAFNVGYGASTPFRAVDAFEMYWHAEGIKTTFEGVVVLNGERYIADPARSYGYSDKNWGSNFTSPWVWLSSCNLVSNITGRRLENSAFDIGGGRPKVYFVPLDRKLLSLFHYEGVDYEFNFSKLWTNCQTGFDCQETDDEIVWHVRQETTTAVMETDVRCKKADMIFANYESPDGAKRHRRLWNGGTGEGRVQLWRKRDGVLTLVDDVAAYNIGCEYGEYDQE